MRRIHVSLTSSTRRALHRRRDRGRCRVQRAPVDDIDAGRRPAGRRRQERKRLPAAVRRIATSRAPSGASISAVKDKWDALAGVSGLAVKDGKLSGRASTAFPLIHVQRTSGLDNQDIVHAIEFRMRVSAGCEALGHQRRRRKAQQ